MKENLFFGILAFVFSFLGTYVYRSIALKKNIVDIPNLRSSHTVPTPRGGGISLVFFCLMYLLYLASFHQNSHLYEIAFSGFIIGFLGILDDKYNLSAKVRFSLQVIIAIFMVWVLDPVPDLYFFNLYFISKYLLGLFFVLFIVWFTNLFNFMDGINGIASLQVITTCLGNIICLMVMKGPEALVGLNLMLLFSSLGFLPWNFPRAKIFMGDVGSAFLGFILVVTTVYLISVDIQYLYIFLILQAVFIFDTTFTLINRFMQNEKVYLPHNQHIYQKLSRFFESHTRVTLSVSVLNVALFLPVSYFVATEVINGIFAVGFIYLVFLIFTMIFNSRASKA